VLITTAILNPVVAIALIPYLTPPAVMAALVTAVGAHRLPATTAPEGSPHNPLQLAAALQMAVLFQAVLMVVHGARELWGTSGVFTSAAVLGLTDVDALTISMARMSPRPRRRLRPRLLRRCRHEYGMKLGVALFFAAGGSRPSGRRSC
jgi:uncharacterized membrane protein (DUF4010 family)